MKEELMYQQLSQVLASVNDGAPELFRQIIISGYIYNITGIVLLFVASLVVIILINIFEDSGNKLFPIIITLFTSIIISIIPIINLLQLIITPKAYILSQLLH